MEGTMIAAVGADYSVSARGRAARLLPSPLKGREMSTEPTTIQWSHDLDRALARAESTRRDVLLDFSAAPM
jgi:hypothetical protein